MAVELYENVIVFEYLIHEKKYISAGNFFNIDGTLLFKIVGTITSYLLIFLGFEKELLKWIQDELKNSTHLEL